MPAKLEKQKEQARTLEAKDPKRAIEAWLSILKLQQEEGDPNPDLAIYNRVGDLFLKLKDPAQAADYYDHAVDAYAELGFHNNAIAMCNKVLRNAPGRQTTYLKLAKLYAAKGFMAEAKQHFIEYAERMQRAGKVQQAFAALKELTDISPESAHLRDILAQHLRRYGDVEQRPGAPAAAPPRPPIESDELTKSGKRKTSNLVFLDVDAPAVPKGKPQGRVSLPPRRPAPPPARPEPERESLIEPVTPEPDRSLEIESTSLAEGVEPTGATGMLEGFETTSTEFGEVRLEAGDVPSVRDEVIAGDTTPLADLEPTVPADSGATELSEPAVELEPLADAELEPLSEGELEIEPPPRPAAPPPPATAAPGGFPRVGSPKPGGPPRVAPVVPKRPGVGAPPRGPSPKTPEDAGARSKVKPVVPRRPAPPGPSAPGGRKPAIEVPPLELETDFQAADAGAAPELAEEEVVREAPRPRARPFFQTEADTSITETERRRSGFIDLGAADVAQGEKANSLVFARIDSPAAKPTVEELEARVADDPDDPEAHQALGEMLIEEGERERGIEELDLATTGFENRGNLPHARDLVEEILRLDPNSVRHRQKQVEFAFKSGDKAKLVDAYLELADALLRGDLPDKARAVYQRVAEHDPQNERAHAALAMLAPVVARPPEPAPARRSKAREGRTEPKDAKMRVRDDVAPTNGDFVDLGAMILDEPMPARDTRMKVADEEPTGDEERDFQGMLARFKQGIEENIDEGDFQAHYDLGIAFKEMGLVDEAIAELQKALRAPEGKLKSSEALGVCFLEKRAYVVAESILRRALELPAAGDQERLGIIYWLGRALEAQGKKPEARDLYGRVFAVDIRFMDVGERAKALARAK